VAASTAPSRSAAAFVEPQIAAAARKQMRAFHEHLRMQMVRVGAQHLLDRNDRPRLAGHGQQSRHVAG
jgi:hypothetical protein